MNTIAKAGRNDVLDLETLELLGGTPEVLDVAGIDLASLKDSVLGRIDRQASLSSFLTIRDSAGIWIRRDTGGETKTLAIDEQTGLESYLLRLGPGEVLDDHHHEEDELCFVIEGDVSTDDLQLNAGDFHFARKGSYHGKARSVHGALMFIQSKVSPEHAIA